MVALETGINEDNKPYNISDNHEVAVINSQKNKGNAQYQHNGAGTLILKDKTMNS